jgi:hypothetical protein
LIIQEAAVSPEGRISPEDLGLWKDEQIEKLQQINSSAVKTQFRYNLHMRVAKQVFQLPGMAKKLDVTQGVGKLWLHQQ